MSEVATVTENNVTEGVSERKQLTPAHKQAATLRRDATLLEKYGQHGKAKELFAQADQIAPVSKQTKRVDPLAVLTAEDQKKLKDYFRTSQGFARLAQVVSAKKLEEIVNELP